MLLPNHFNIEDEKRRLGLKSETGISKKKEKLMIWKEKKRVDFSYPPHNMLWSTGLWLLLVCLIPCLIEGKRVRICASDFLVNSLSTRNPEAMKSSRAVIVSLYLLGTALSRLYLMADLHWRDLKVRYEKKQWFFNY